MPRPRRSISHTVISALLGGAVLLLRVSPALGQPGPDAEGAPAAEASAEPAADLSEGVPVESVPDADLGQPEEPPEATPEPEAPQEEEVEETPPPASAEPGADLSQGAPAEEGPPSSPEPAALPAEAPITLDGQGSLVSRPFGLRGGEYAVSWTAQTSSPECTLNATLHASEDGRPIQPLGGGQVFGNGASGQTSVHDLPGASYYVETISTCRWSITITPLP